MSHVWIYNLKVFVFAVSDGVSPKALEKTVMRKSNLRRNFVFVCVRMSELLGVLLCPKHIYCIVWGEIHCVNRMFTCFL